jgi:hypothetical protein
MTSPMPGMQPVLLASKDPTSNGHASQAVRQHLRNSRLEHVSDLVQVALAHRGAFHHLGGHRTVGVAKSEARQTERSHLKPL